MIEIHIVAGLLSLLAGGTALFAAKGSPLHRKAGIVFVGAMIVMTVSAFLIALTFRPNRVNVVVAVLTFYLVTSALLTVKRKVAEVRWLTAGLAVLALGAAARALALGIEALGSPDGVIDRVPAPPLFLFAAVGAIGGLMDLRLLRAGAIEGVQRLVRHLWRMTFALWIATTSFFIGQAKMFPDPLRKIYLLAIPVLIVLVMLLYWLGRVLFRKERAA